MLRRSEFACEGPSKASCAEALTERRTWQPAVRARCARELEFARVVDLPKASQHLETTGGRGMEQPRRARRIQKKCRLMGANRSTFSQLLHGALSRQLRDLAFFLQGFLALLLAKLHGLILALAPNLRSAGHVIVFREIYLTHRWSFLAN